MRHSVHNSFPVRINKGYKKKKIKWPISSRKSRFLNHQMVCPTALEIPFQSKSFWKLRSEPLYKVSELLFLLITTSAAFHVKNWAQHYHCLWGETVRNCACHPHNKKHTVKFVSQPMKVIYFSALLQVNHTLKVLLLVSAKHSCHNRFTWTCSLCEYCETGLCFLNADIFSCQTLI